MPNDRRNVFVSHIHEDDAGLSDLSDLLEKHGMEVRNYSITSDKENNAQSADYIRSQILAPRINACSTLVVYITPETKNSDWVNWEIEYAHKQDKTIVGVWEQGNAGCDIPEALEEVGDTIVGWSGKNIVSAINGDYKGKENPDGTQITCPTPIERHPCT